MTLDSDKCRAFYNGKSYPCHISMAMDLIGGRWKTVILHYLKDGEKRFSELKKIIPDITEMTLSIQLKQLEKDGLIHRTVYGIKPPIKVIYAMTEIGYSFVSVLDAISIWAEKLVPHQG